MAYLCTFQCTNGFVMDVYDSPRIPKNNNKGYYITLNGIKEVEVWMAEQGYTDKIADMKDIEFFISKKWIRSYEN